MRLLPVALVFLTGCWPLIPGKYGGGEAELGLVVGEVRLDRFLGQYWSDTIPSSSAYAAVLSIPQDVYHLDAYGPSLGACQHNAAAPAWWANFASDGSGAVTFTTGASTITAPWDVTNSRFSSAVAPSGTAAPGEVWSGSGVNAGGYGLFNLDPAVAMPNEFTLTAPQVDTVEPIALTLADLPLAWTGGEDADEMLAEVFMMDADGNTLELVECRMPNTGSFVVPLATLTTQWATASYAILRVSAATQMNDVLEIHEQGGNRMAGIIAYQGAFNTN
ncbi:MAG: hypothetical protein KC912_05605 [Proteobacteria bacterium]|nr:hypothetical protein [Pseudomonadota bacterium]